MSYGVQQKAKNSSLLPKAVTIVCSVLAVCFLVLSVTMMVSVRSKTQKIEEVRAEAQSASAKAAQLEEEIASTKNQAAQTGVKKEAKEWCNDFSPAATATITDLDKQAKKLNTMTQTKRDAIAEVCPQKKKFAEALTKDLKHGMVDTSAPQCTGDGTRFTISGTVSLDAPTMLSLGSIDITYEVFAADHDITDSDSPVGTAVATVSPTGTGSYYASYPLATNGDFQCAVRPKTMWPTGL